MKTVEILLKLCSSLAGSGNEGETAKQITAILNDYNIETKTDNLGNLIATVNKDCDNGILLIAHMDKIGLIVTGIDKATGFLRVAPCGGIDARCLAAQRVKVLGSKTLDGVIISTPPHLAAPDSDKKAVPVDKQAVDCGLAYEEIIKYVAPGDRIFLNAPFTEMKDGSVNSPFIDNSAGCTVLIKTLVNIINSSCKRRVTAVFSTREETGKQGATAAAFGVYEKEAIVTDVSFACAPEVKPEYCSKAGSGVMIGCSPVLNNLMFSKMKALAEQNSIPYTVEVAGSHTGTDADACTTAREGIKTSLLSIPLKNMHTPAETVKISDIDAVCELMTAYILKEDE